MATKTKKAGKGTAKFDYKIIKTFEDACKKENVDPEKLPDVSALPEEFHKPIMAAYKLFIIFKAINNGWRPDWSKSSQYKYYPWYYVLSSGFGFDNSLYYFTDTHASVGSRLCTDTSEKALYIAKQFEAEYRDYLLYSE
jgi:hypothetical protein